MTLEPVAPSSNPGLLLVEEAPKTPPPTYAHPGFEAKRRMKAAKIPKEVMWETVGVTSKNLNAYFKGALEECKGFSQEFEEGLEFLLTPELQSPYSEKMAKEMMKPTDYMVQGSDRVGDTKAYQEDAGCFAVMDGDEVIGAITKLQVSCSLSMSDNPPKTLRLSIERIMIKKPFPTVDADAFVRDFLYLTRRHPALAVVSHGKLVGLVNRRVLIPKVTRPRDYFG